jgi:threonine aldolase
MRQSGRNTFARTGEIWMMNGETNRAPALGFSSDNIAGASPEVAQAIVKHSTGQAGPYGSDELTAQVRRKFCEIFERDVEVLLVPTGTAANALCLSAMTPPWGNIYCHPASHINNDECGAPEFFSNGSKLLTAQTSDGKMTPEAIRTLATSRQDIHFPKPKAVTITQSTETGRIYSLAELRDLSETCRDLKLHLHMDGSRFANAVAGIGCTPAEMTWKSGVEVLCFGGTKNGMAIGEAIVFFNHTLAQDFDYRCKQAGQLASKMRFLSSPWVGMLQSGAWQRNAAHANACARRLHDAIADLPNASIMYPTEANAVFLMSDEDRLQQLRERGWRFYTFIGGSARFMFAWDTDVARVDQLAADIRDIMG